MAPRIPASVRSFPRFAQQCALCAGRSTTLNVPATRQIATSFLDKVAAGEQRWEERAQKISSGEIAHPWDVLNERGYIKDVAGNPDRIREILRIKRVGGYVGVDPTADSMHVGHLLPMMALFWMWMQGYPAVLLLGGSTARIGDPTDRMDSRKVLSNAEIGKNITKIHYQLGRLWDNVVKLREKYGYEDDWAAKRALYNNNMWLGNLTLYDFSKRLARNMRMGPLLSRDTVKRRLNESEEGMSLGEFMYPLLQGWDFWHLHNKQNVQFQIGGSDQYGNIVSGIEVLKTVRESEEAPHFKMDNSWQNEPFGFTVPLLTDSSGAKFGKSAGNAVWLDEFKTSPFELYGYFMRRPDEDLEKLLKLFTFMPLKRISQIMEEHMREPSKRIANHHLAFEVLSLVYGSQRALQEAQQHQFRFGGELPTIDKVPSDESGIITSNNAPRSDIQLPQSVMKLPPAKILHACGLASSASDGHRLLTKKGAYVAAQPGQRRGLVPGNLSWTPMELWYPEDSLKFLIDDKLLILRKGKHNVRIIELVPDEEWKASGKVYPGEPYTGTLRRVVKKLKEDYAAKGEEVSEAEIRRMLKELKDADAPTVANNPNIELLSKAEMRLKKTEEKVEKAKSRSS
ncbi:Tyrosine--tRNA ligase-like protein [Emericellopsis cladophorae]|uniref:Tyrosine--tRNA ligase n=1 Tax=Emericellopsis cladophorae TaxID=2686198 RepID=A0A9Q0BEX0_9HYPO|nr:Tyrosine--tRNA ligase-like protein [Emericellopsis cladophorae]KAI6783362.1 Tyrosine--tRNA ligase-like protein [Emericellopsis cladophorae]